MRLCQKSVLFHFYKDNGFCVRNQRVYVRNQCFSTLTKIMSFLSEISECISETVRFHFDKDNEFYVRNQCIYVGNQCVSTLTKIMSFMSEISASVSEISAFPLSQR